MNYNPIVKYKRRSGVCAGALNAIRSPLNAPRASPGIALVMVLGVLSVMVIMAVAFAISMRTERVAAGNYADSVRARQLVHTGIARALSDLAGKLGANGLMGAGGLAYPPWAVTNSYTTNYANTSTNNLLLTGEATNFVPRALWDVAKSADSSDASRHWLLIESIVNNTNGVVSNTVGRVKYLVLNCSGLLDANFAGSAGTDRGLGTNPSELAIGKMPEMGDAAAFFTARGTHVRYETQAELAALNKNFNGAPSNFTVYSHALPGYWGGFSNQPQVNLAGNESNLIGRQAAIISAFTNAGISLPNAGTLFTNLLDYVDGDSNTRNPATSVEPGPLISRITYASTPAPGPYTITVTFTLWNPFVGSGGGSNAFNALVEIFNSGGGSLGTIILASNNIPGTLSTTDAGAYKIRINSASVTRGADTVDVLAINTILPNQLINGESITWECIDPRFNYEVGNAAYWEARVPAWPDSGPTNGVTRKYWNTWSADQSVDKDAAMYVANAPLRSVAELGYLAYAPWKTVKLYGPNLQRVLDVFAIGTNTADTYVTNTSVRGRVNPNSRQTEVMSAVFSNMPVDEYPGPSAPPAVTITAPEIQAAVAKIMTAYGTNLSDFGRQFAAADLPGDNELKKEALFRNTCGLLSVRQNLFTIIIEAQVASGGNIPRSPVRQRAAALVWRDPYTGEMFVRSIKWLKD